MRWAARRFYGGGLMQEAELIQERLKLVFQEIENTRMDGVPMLNNKLSVAAIGFEQHGDFYLGILLTPWFMNLMLLPVDVEAYKENSPVVGEKTSIMLPAGLVEFIVGFEENIGYSLSCSLFSPLFEFEDQGAALETAKTALAEVLNINTKIIDEDPGMTQIWAGKLPEPEISKSSDAEQIYEPAKNVSRRDFFRGGKTQDKTAGIDGESF